MRQQQNKIIKKYIYYPGKSWVTRETCNLALEIEITL
jgi:hypothetical protein